MKKTYKVKAVAILFILFAVVIAIFTFGGGKQDWALKIDKIEIPVEEIKFYMAQERANVAAYFYQTYGVDSNGEEFWNSSYHGENPFEMLKERTKEKLIQDKVERMMASDHGIEVDISYEQLNSSLIKQNSSMEDGENGINYGPSQFDYMEYVSITQIELVTKIKDELLAESPPLTEQEQMDLYDQYGETYGYADYEEFLPYSVNFWVNELFDNLREERIENTKVYMNEKLWEGIYE